MKIAFIGQKGIPAISGGVEKYVENLSTRLVSLNQEVLVYNRRDYLLDPLEEHQGVKIINISYLKGKNLAAITQTYLALRDALRRQVDIIHFQGIGPSLLSWLPKLLNPRLKIVSTLHSFDYYNEKWGFFAKFMLRWGEHLMVRHSDSLIVLSQSAQNYIKEKYHKDSILIPNGANLYKKEDNDQIKKFGLKTNDYLLSVSRIIKLKGIQYIIKAFKKIKTDKKLVIVGEGDYKDKLEKLAEDDQRIIFIGNQNGEVLDQLYANAYFFIQSSEMEGLSTSLLEAMAHHKACLASDIEANKEALADSGFYFLSKDIDDLQNKLEYLLNNQKQVEEKAEKTYRRIENNFTWTEIAKNILKVYQRVFDKK